MKLRYDAFHKLMLSLPGGPEYRDVTPIRCFPLTHRDKDIALVDDRGHEVHYIESLDHLEPEVRAFLEADLKARELLPRILRIDRISKGAEPTTWEVETDAGRAEFKLSSEDHLKRAGAGAILTDAGGVRYLIPSIDALDRRSRRWLLRYL